jgi:hypothetical protein
MSIRIFNEASFGLNLVVRPWVMSKAFGLPSESTSHILEICMEGLKLQGIVSTTGSREEGFLFHETPT